MFTFAAMLNMLAINRKSLWALHILTSSRSEFVNLIYSDRNA